MEEGEHKLFISKTFKSFKKKYNNQPLKPKRIFQEIVC